jgi:hypothetical protein
MAMAGDAKLRIVRHGGYADFLRSYKIFVNDVTAGTISRNAVLDLEVPSGRLKIEARVDWGRSQPLVVDAAPGQTITVEVSNHWGAWLSLWAITFGARSYLELNEVR